MDKSLMVNRRDQIKEKGEMRVKNRALTEDAACLQTHPHVSSEGPVEFSLLKADSRHMQYPAFPRY